MKRLVLVRHGKMEHPAGMEITAGWSNMPLSRKGRRQANLVSQAIAVMLGDHAFEFFSSDLLRASQTAEIIGQKLGSRPIVTHMLREQSNGQAAEMLPQEARLLELPRKGDPLDWIVYPGAESRRMLFNRITGYLHRIDKLVEGTVLIVTHADVINVAVCWWLGLPVETFAQVDFRVNRGGITDLRLSKEGTPVLYRHNSTAHLR